MKLLSKDRLKTATNNDDKRRVNELKALRNLRPCVGPDKLFRIDGRLENADQPVDTKHPLILPGRHHLTRLIVLYEHTKSGHAGPSYTLMNTRQRYWIIHGIGSVKHYLAECEKCSILKAKPVRQLMADLPECRLTLANKPFKFCGLDYLGYYYFREGRSNRKAWGLLFTCLCTRCLHVEVVTSLDLDSFLLALSLALPTCEWQWTQSTLATAPLFALPLSVYRTCLIRLTFTTHCAKLILTGLRFHLTLPARVERGK